MNTPRSLPAARFSRAASPARRRHRTRQRERILQFVRASESHPTASQVHRALLAEFPRLSLATVYRNLEVLVSEGGLREVPVPTGPVRFDGNVDLHHHFVCDACGHIEDVEVRVPPGLSARLRRRYKLRPERFRIDFYGLCHACTSRDANPTH